jgi:hypothetical protein
MTTLTTARVRALLAGLVVLAAALPAPAASNASKALLSELGAAADTIKTNLKQLQRDPPSIALGTIEELSAKPLTNGGPGMAELLTEALAEKGVKVDDEAATLLKGEYSAKVERAAGDEILKVNLVLRMFERNGEELVVLPARFNIKLSVSDNTDIARTLAVNAALSPSGDRKTRNEEIQQARQSPDPVVTGGTRVSAAPGSPFAVEVLVRDRLGAPAVPAPVRVVKGQPFVDIPRGKLYEVKVYNDSTHEAAVTLAVDGIDSFTFSEEVDPATKKPLFSHYIVDAGRSAEVKGWHVTNKKTGKNVLSFLVTAYGEGAASKLKRTGAIGVLSVTFAASWEKESQMPADEGQARDAGGNETGFGPPQEVGFNPVKRNFGAPRAVVSIRYTR